MVESQIKEGDAKAGILSILGQDKGYTAKYNPLPERVLEGKAKGNSKRQRIIFDCLFQVES